MTTIIVPTDFSNNAYNALFYASRLVPQEKCKILLVHSYEKELDHKLSILDPTKNENIVEDLRRNVSEQLEAVKHQIIRDSEDINLRIETYIGSHALNEMINDLILKIDVRFVVMGTKGASGLKEVFLGSQAVSVLKNIQPVPLFLISKKTDFKLPKNIAYAADFKSTYPTSHYSFLQEFVKNHKALLNVSHVYDPNENQAALEPFYKSLKNQLQKTEFVMHWIAQNTDIEDDLAHFCKEHGIDLLALTYHKYGFFKSMVKKSLVEKASFHLDIPLLILPENN